jgi:hypothetical protein
MNPEVLNIELSGTDTNSNYPTTLNKDNDLKTYLSRSVEISHQYKILVCL